MPIDFKHPDYVEHQPIWKRIDDCTRLKNLKSYIPTLNPSDKSVGNAERNQAYKERAVFYAVTRQTITGLLGLMFSKAPSIELQIQLEYMMTNIDGAGISLYQQMKASSDDVTRFGRAGLYPSFPKRDAPASRADIQNLTAVAAISRIEPQSIINWRTKQRGAQIVLSLVVIQESVDDVKDDGYTTESIDQIRELYLDNDVYSERLWRKNAKKEWEVHESYVPKDSAGKTFDTIQFHFIGSENNDHNVDSPPAQALTDINFAHFLNSADWEDSVFFAGQPQSWMSGVSQARLDYMKENNIYVGSRNPITLEDGGQFGFASPNIDPLSRVAMMDKVELMVALGALLIQPNGSVKTATEAAGDIQARHSPLSMIAMNVSEAYSAALASAGRFMGTSEAALVELSTDFVRPETSPQELQAIMTGFIQGSVPIGQYVEYMQSRGFFDAEKSLEEMADELTP